MRPAYMLRLLRRDEERELVSRCTITRGRTPNVTTVYQDRRCRVRPSLRATRTVESGGQQVTLHLYDVKVAWDTDARRGDVVRVTGSNDPGLTGRWLTVVEVVTDDYLVTRVLVCQESR